MLVIPLRLLATLSTFSVPISQDFRQFLENVGNSFKLLATRPTIFQDFGNFFKIFGVFSLKINRKFLENAGNYYYYLMLLGNSFNIFITYFKIFHNSFKIMASFQDFSNFFKILAIFLRLGNFFKISVK